MTLHPDPHCPLCLGRGFIESEEGAMGCACLSQGSVAPPEDEARVPLKFRNRSLDTFKIGDLDSHVSATLRQVLEKMRGYTQNFCLEMASEEDGDRIFASECNGLLLLGPSGAGKTHLAVGVLREVMARGYRGAWWNVNELFRSMRESFSRGEGDSHILEEAIRCDLLVLDDLCSEKGSEYVLDRLYAIINGRYEALRPLIVTSNLSQNELAETLGARLVSRLGEMCQRIEMPRRDYRLAALQTEAFKVLPSRRRPAASPTVRPAAPISAPVSLSARRMAE
jgi:DNA replication protein DnaC